MKLINTKNLFRTMLAAAAIAVVLCVPSAQASSVIVSEDDGGGNGSVAGHSSGTNNLTSSGFLSTYNGGVGTFPNATIGWASSTTLIDTAGVLSGSGTKTLSYGVNTITFGFNVLYDAAGDYSTIGAKTLTVVGAITSVTGSSGLVLDGYDFSPFQSAGSTLSLTWTKSTTGFNWNNVVNHNVTQSGVGAGLQQDAAAVPEPTSVAMMGLGLIATLGIGRLRRRKLA